MLCSIPASRRAGLPLDAISIITTILLIGTVKDSRFPTSEAVCARQIEGSKAGVAMLKPASAERTEIDGVIAPSP